MQQAQAAILLEAQKNFKKPVNVLQWHSVVYASLRSFCHEHHHHPECLARR
jgi:hypothetical protein